MKHGIHTWMVEWIVVTSTSYELLYGSWRRWSSHCKVGGRIPWFVANSWAWLPLYIGFFHYNSNTYLVYNSRKPLLGESCIHLATSYSVKGAVSFWMLIWLNVLEVQPQLSIQFSWVQAYLTELDPEFIKGPWGMVFCINRGSLRSFRMEILC